MIWRPDIPDSKEKYQSYLASREWWIKRNAVYERADGYCERCNENDGVAVHHLTYIRKYQEQLSDLQLLCEDCHNFTHGRSDYDPLEAYKKYHDDLDRRYGKHCHGCGRRAMNCVCTQPDPIIQHNGSIPYIWLNGKWQWATFENICKAKIAIMKHRRET
jgi:hypothetical protein